MDVDFKSGYSPDGVEANQKLYVDGETQNKDPLRPFKFLVTVVQRDPVTEHILFGVTKISGLKWKVGTFKYYDGGGAIPRSVPTRPEYEPLVLTRAVFPTDEVWEWCKRVFNLRNGFGNPNFRVETMHIYQLSYYAQIDEVAGIATPTVERAWNVGKSYPSEYDMGELDREADGVSLATITLEHEGCVADDALMEAKRSSISYNVGTKAYTIS